MSILTVEHFDQVRAAVDISLIDPEIDADEDQILPDSIIAMDIYQGLAELAVEERDPDFASRTGSDLLRVRNAAVYFTASLLVPAIPFLTREVFGDYSYTRKDFDLDAHARKLWSRGEGMIAAVTGTDQMPPFFDVACGYRGL
jgi:hypothetical protein